MLDKVHAQLHKRDSNLLAFSAFLIRTEIPVIDMPTDSEILKEYLLLKKIMDDGEAACLAVAKFRKEYVASSNITQIGTYCKANCIVYYTTIDILLEAMIKKIMTEAECDKFIKEVRARGSRLPCISIADYRKMKNVLLEEVN
jgi:hypothetical protein